MRRRFLGETQCSSDLQQATTFTKEAKGETPSEFMEHQTLRAKPVPAFSQYFAEQSKAQDTTTCSTKRWVCRLTTCAAQVETKSLDCPG
jgi:hypothetical protein